MLQKEFINKHSDKKEWKNSQNQFDINRHFRLSNGNQSNDFFPTDHWLNERTKAENKQFCFYFLAKNFGFCTYFVLPFLKLSTSVGGGERGDCCTMIGGWFVIVVTVVCVDDAIGNITAELAVSRSLTNGWLTLLSTIVIVFFLFFLFSPLFLFWRSTSNRQ